MSLSRSSSLKPGFLMAEAVGMTPFFMASFMVWIEFMLFIAAAPITFSSDLRMQQATNFISARSPTTCTSSHPFVTPVKASELLNCRVQKKGMLSSGNFLPAMFRAATEPWQMASLQCSIRFGSPLYQQGQLTMSPAAQTSFWLVSRNTFVFSPPPSCSSPFANASYDSTPVAMISTSVGRSLSSRETASTLPSLLLICRTLALVMILTPFFSDSLCSTPPILSPSTCLRGVLWASTRLTLRSLSSMRMEEAISMPMKPPPMMVTFLTPGARRASSMAVQSFLLRRLQQLVPDSPQILGIRFFIPEAISSLSQASGALPSISTFLPSQSILVTFDPRTTTMPLFSRDCSLRMAEGGCLESRYLLSSVRSQGRSASLVIMQMQPLQPVFRRVSAADSPAEPAPMITIFSFLFMFSLPSSLYSGAAPQAFLGMVTLIRPSARSTLKVFSPSNTGPPSSCPVLIEKPALCREQTILSPISSPLARLKPKWAHLLWMENISPWQLMTRMVSSGLGPTSNSRTSPYFKLSSVSSTVISSGKTLEEVNQAERESPSEARPTFTVGPRLCSIEVTFTLENDLRRSLLSFILNTKISL